MKRYISCFLALALVISFPTVCFAAEQSPSLTEEAEWEQMMALAEETFPELKADMDYAMGQSTLGMSTFAANEVPTSESVVFHKVRSTADGGVLGVTKFESGTYSFVYSADWITYSSSGSAKIASFQVWYSHIRVVVSVHSLKFVFTPAANDYFQDTGYAVAGPYSQVWPVATKISEDSSGPAYSYFEVQWSAEIMGILVAETMGIKIEVGGDSVSVYINGEHVL